MIRPIRARAGRLIPSPVGWFLKASTPNASDVGRIDPAARRRPLAVGASVVWMFRIDETFGHFLRHVPARKALRLP